MDGEIVRLTTCIHCEASLEESARFCSQCGKAVMTDSAPDVTFRAAATEFFRDTVSETRTLGKEALRSEAGKKVAAGAALGAAAGLVLPLVGPAIGATLGAGYVALKRLTK